MSFNFTLSQLISILDAKAHLPSDTPLETPATGISTDSRILHSGQVFVALRGERFDGHEFVRTAMAKGALVAIVDEKYEPEPDTPVIVVPDTLPAYQALGRAWRQQFSIPIIGVTGSVGKTTTKELIAAVLATKGNVLKTQLNYNNEIGVPKTLLELSPNHDFAVIEMAMRGAGQIAELTDIALPTIGLITNVGTAHIELLGSEDAIARAKCELLERMSPDSIAILNADNQRLISTAATVWHGKTITYGLTNGDLRGSLQEGNLVVEGMGLPVPLPGRHNALNYLAALAVAKELGVSWAPLHQGLYVDLPGGRAKRYELPNDIIVLDETYNAGLESMTAALQLLAETPGNRRIAVLGTMKELGERSSEFHERIGNTAKELNLDALFVFAEPNAAEAIAMGAVGLPMIEIMDTTKQTAHDELAERLHEFVQPGDVLLFKASHSVALDRTVDKFRTLTT